MVMHKDELDRHKVALENIVNRARTLATEYAAKRQEAMREHDPVKRNSLLATAQLEFVRKTKPIEDEMNVTLKSWSADQGTPGITNEAAQQALTELQAKLETTRKEEVVSVLLDQVAQADDALAFALSGTDSVDLLRDQLTKTGSSRKETEQLLPLIQKGASARLQQHGRYSDGTGEHKDVKQFRQFYETAVPQLVTDVREAVTNPKDSSVVYFPALPGSGDAPVLIDFSTSTEGDES